MKYKAGDKVMARWPGTALYFHATIKSTDEADDSANVLYEDGTEMDIPMDYVKTEAYFKRRKSKSPARRRSRSRSKSPGRQPKPKKVVEKRTPRRSAKPSLSTTTTTSSSSEDVRTGRSPSRTTVERSRRFDTTETERTKGLEKITTRSYQAKLVVEKADGDSAMSSRKPDATVTAARETIESVKKAIRQKYEFGGPFGVVFQYVVTPISILLLVTSFKATKCELLKFKSKHILQDPASYFDLQAALTVLGFILFHAVLYTLPLGETVEGPRTYSGKKIEYRLNAFYTLFITVLAYSALLQLKYPVMIVYDKTLEMAATCCALSFVFNFLLHIKSLFAEEDELNPSANTGCTIYDIFMGHELHPRLSRYYHLKLLIYRVAMTALILINIVYLQKELTATGTIRPSVAIVAGCQMVYSVMVFFWDEAQTIYSFDIKNEGLGFQNIIGNLAIVPFFYSAHTRYLIDHPKAALVPMPILVTAVAALVLGLGLVVLSNLQKTYFRQNPYNPNLAALDSIPPSRKGGRRLIVSGYWGFVRHPNYLGEILLGLGYGLMCGFSDVFPWVYFIFVTGLLIHRSLRDEERCRETHGYSWTEYCRRVPYRIVPYVF